jgi:hypothetical protein
MHGGMRRQSVPEMTTPLARDKPGHDAIDRPRAFDYNGCAAAVCLDGIATRDVVGRRCGMQEYTSLEERDHGRCADVAR